MTGHREWLVNYDATRKCTIRFADHRVIAAEGSGNVMVRRKDGKQEVITNVLYVPGMKNNLISVGQLIEKGFSVKIRKVFMEVFDESQEMVLKIPGAKNRTYKVCLETCESQCLFADDAWL